MTRQIRGLDLSRISKRVRLDVDFDKLNKEASEDDSKMVIDGTSLWSKSLPEYMSSLDKQIRDRFVIDGKTAVMWRPPSDKPVCLKPGNLIHTRVLISSVDTVLTVEINKTKKDVFLKSGEAYSMSMIPATLHFDQRRNVKTEPRKGHRQTSFTHRLNKRNIYAFNYTVDLTDGGELPVTEEMMNDDDILSALDELSTVPEIEEICVDEEPVSKEPVPEEPVPEE